MNLIILIILATLAIIIGAIVLIGFLALMFRRVVATNEVHIIQSAKNTISYGKDTGNGNTYYEWPSWIPIFGVTKIILPVSVFDINLNSYEAYDKGRVPFIVDITAFFRIKDSNVAAQRVANFEEFRLDLPIFIATDNVKTASLALPYPKEREAAYNNIGVSNGKQKVTTELLTDVDSMFMAEFKKKLPTIVTKAVTKLTLQTVAQAVAQNKLGDLGGIAMSVYSVATAGADLRSWYSLPKNVQLAKINKSGSELTLSVGGKDYKTEVSADGNSIVYVRVPVAGAEPVINVINL